MQAAGRLPERIALDVEDDVARRRTRQELEPAPGVGSDGVPVEAPRGPPLELQRRLVAQDLEGVLGDVGDLRVRRGPRERGEGGEIRRAQSHHLIAPHVGDLHEVVFGLPARRAHAAEVAERAVLDGVGLGRRRPDDRPLEPGAHPAVVRREVVVA